MMSSARRSPGHFEKISKPPARMTFGLPRRPGYRGQGAPGQALPVRADREGARGEPPVPRVRTSGDDLGATAAAHFRAEPTVRSCSWAVLGTRTRPFRTGQAACPRVQEDAFAPPSMETVARGVGR